jgi:hypothetical protein
VTDVLENYGFGVGYAVSSPLAYHVQFTMLPPSPSSFLLVRAGTTAPRHHFPPPLPLPPFFLPRFPILLRIRFLRYPILPRHHTHIFNPCLSNAYRAFNPSSLTPSPLQRRSRLTMHMPFMLIPQMHYPMCDTLRCTLSPGYEF